MNFSWIDFLVGFLLVESILHLSFAHSGKSMPSLFGKTPKANIVFSVLMLGITLEIYSYANGFSALMNNGMLLGIIDMYLCYLIFGRWFHNRLQNDEKKIKKTTVMAE